MSSPQIDVGAGHRERQIMYAVAGVVVLVLVIVGLVVHSANAQTKEAKAKADQLIAALQRHGVQNPPSQEQIVGVLGTDGGATCDNPSKSLAKASLFSLLMNGAAGPGMRPIIADSSALKGQLLILQIYCPDQFPQVQDLVNKLKTADVIKQ